MPGDDFISDEFESEDGVTLVPSFAIFQEWAVADDSLRTSPCSLSADANR